MRARARVCVCVCVCVCTHRCALEDLSGVSNIDEDEESLLGVFGATSMLHLEIIIMHIFINLHHYYCHINLSHTYRIDCKPKSLGHSVVVSTGGASSGSSFASLGTAPALIILRRPVILCTPDHSDTRSLILG